LTNGKFAIVDKEDYEILNKFSWYAKKDRNIYYAVRDIIVNGKKKTIRMHREIMGVKDRWVIIDHKNGDGLLNTRENLRKCTQKENLRNHSVHCDSLTGYTGVTFEKGGKRKSRYKARIVIDGKIKFLGFHPTPEKAAKKYNEAALEHFGEFARLNDVRI